MLIFYGILCSCLLNSSGNFCLINQEKLRFTTLSSVSKIWDPYFDRPTNRKLFCSDRCLYPTVTLHVGVILGCYGVLIVICIALLNLTEYATDFVIGGGNGIITHSSRRWLHNKCIHHSGLIWLLSRLTICPLL